VQAVQRHDPGAMASAVLALTVHAMLFVVLFFGIRWRTKQPEPVMAELWSQLPAIEAPRPAPPPPPAIEPKPAPRPEPRPEPKAEPKPAPKPDIAIEQEKKRKDEAEKKQREEAEKKKREDELKAKAEAERREKDLAENRRRAEQAAELKRLQDQLAREGPASPKSAAPTTGAPPVAGDPMARSLWADRIRAKIRPYVIVPPELQGNPEAVFDVQLLPSGDVLAVKLTKPSGSRAYDEAVERAILKSSPLPLPEKRETFESRLTLKFRPND